MIEDVLPTPVIIMGEVQTADTVERTTITAGRPQVTEASGAAIAVSNQNILNTLRGSVVRPLFGPSNFTLAALASAAQPRLVSLALTTDAVGDVAATIVVPALAGYQSCLSLQYVWADDTDPAWDLTVAASAGLIVGPTALVGLASVANEIGPTWQQGDYGGLLYQTADDNVDITLLLANAGNVITYLFYGILWYET